MFAEGGGTGGLFCGDGSLSGADQSLSELSLHQRSDDSSQDLGDQEIARANASLDVDSSGECVTAEKPSGSSALSKQEKILAGC